MRFKDSEWEAMSEQDSGDIVLYASNGECCYLSSPSDEIYVVGKSVFAPRVRIGPFRYADMCEKELRKQKARELDSQACDDST